MRLQYERSSARIGAERLAKIARNNPTKSEERFREILTEMEYKFFTQRPFYRANSIKKFYIADFYLPLKKEQAWKRKGRKIVQFGHKPIALIIEIDGGTHTSLEQMGTDLVRTKELQDTSGNILHILRIQNEQVFEQDIYGKLSRIIKRATKNCVKAHIYILQ